MTTNDTVTSCGTQFLVTQTTNQPTFRAFNLNATANYVFLMVDRDAPNATNPSSSPILHMMIAGIPGSSALLGVGGANASDFDEITAYRRPQPPTGSGCHRYYFMVYMQTTTDAVNGSTTGNQRFDFPTWATNNKLVKVAVNYFQTQFNGETAVCSAPAPVVGAPMNSPMSDSPSDMNVTSTAGEVPSMAGDAPSAAADVPTTAGDVPSTGGSTSSDATPSAITSSVTSASEPVAQGPSVSTSTAPAPSGPAGNTPSTQTPITLQPVVTPAQNPNAPTPKASASIVDLSIALVGILAVFILA